MPKPAPATTTPDVRVTLDVHRLNLLHQRRADGHAGVSAAFLARRQCLTHAALKRAASGRPVRFRTVRHLAAFYGIGVEALIAPGPAAAAAPAGTPFAVERMQCAGLFDAVLATGRGRLVDVQGAPGSDKSVLLAECAEDARRRGFGAIVLGLAGRDERDPHPLATLVRALLYIGPADARADVPELVRSRCRALDLCAEHVDGFLGLLEGPSAWPLPVTNTVQAAALCALVRQRARRQPLALAVDDLQCADWRLGVMLDTVLPATLDLPVAWMLASEQPAGTPRTPLGPRLEALPRTTFHLAGVPGAHAVPCAASVLRRARTPRIN